MTDEQCKQIRDCVQNYVDKAFPRDSAEQFGQLKRQTMVQAGNMIIEAIIEYDKISHSND